MARRGCSQSCGWAWVFTWAASASRGSCDWTAWLASRIAASGGWKPDTATHEDLVKRQFRADAPNRLWFCDITQHRARDGWVYCAAVIDAYSRRIVGWSISDRITAEIVVDALEMARWRRRPEPGTVVHADRGAQYTSWLFGHRLRQAGLLGSMGRVASSVDNALIESFWSTMQRELLDRRAGTRGRSSRRPCSSGSRAFTTPAAGTRASATSAPPTTKPFTPPQKSRHDQHTRTVRETGSGSPVLRGRNQCPATRGPIFTPVRKLNDALRETGLEQFLGPLNRSIRVPSISLSRRVRANRGRRG